MAKSPRYYSSDPELNAVPSDTPSPLPDPGMCEGPPPDSEPPPLVLKSDPDPDPTSPAPSPTPARKPRAGHNVRVNVTDEALAQLEVHALLTHQSKDEVIDDLIITHVPKYKAVP